MTFMSQNFDGVLDGVKIEDLNKKIDYSKTCLKDRKKIVNDILSDTDFYEDYFDNYFNASINSNGSLSEDVNVCRSLEQMANYLLTSDEVKQEDREKKTKYVFHTDENYFQKKVNREKSIRQIMNIENDDHEDNVIHILRTSEENYKLKKKQTPDLKYVRESKYNTKKDVERVTRIIKEYQLFIDFITEKLISKDRSVNRYLLTKTKGTLMDDIIVTKDALLGIWGYKLKPSSETRKPDMDIFDFTNINHVLGTHLTFINNKEEETAVKVNGLMYFKPQQLDSEDEFTFVLLDFENTVAKAGLTKRERQVLEHLRNGLRNVDIEREMNISETTVRYDISLIAKKIIKVGNKYDYE